jgi:hypothetical protein
VRVPEKWTQARRECARYRGKLYSSSDRPPGKMALFEDDPANPVAVVPIGELDEWYDVEQKCSFLGHDEFSVSMESDDSYLIDYVGGDGKWVDQAWAEGEQKYPRVGFQQLDRYSYSAAVPKDMVENVREERRDNLTPWRERQERERSS